MISLAEFCSECIQVYAAEAQREREHAQLGGVTLGQGRTGHKQHIRVRRQVLQLSPKFWASRQVRALQEDAAVRVFQSTRSEGW